MAFTSLHRAALALIIVFPAMTGAALAARDCGNTSAGFEQWVQRFKQQLRQQGISQRTIDRAFRNVSYNHALIRKDRNQKAFKKSFDAFWRLRVNDALIRLGCKKLKTHRRWFDRAERVYGVPREMIAAIWGMETIFGRYMGKHRTPKVVSALATLAWDCRRSDMFRRELAAFLRILDRREISPASFRGGLYAEIGQTQFMPSKFLQYAVDFNGDGRRDLTRSVPDIIGSTANFLRAHGWRPGAGYQPGQPNYRVLNSWNRATVYQQALAKLAGIFATRCR